MPHNEDGEPSTLSERITELSRKVSVEAGVGPIALYASRSRSASSSSANRPTNVQFTEPADSERGAKQRALSRCAEKPTLPRIDSEKTLAPVFADDDDEEDTERAKEPPSPSSPVSQLEMKATRTTTRASAMTAQSEKSRPAVDDDQRTIEEIEEEIVAKMSKTRKILLGFVMMMNVFIASMMSNGVLVTIPVMARDLGVSQLEAQWVASAYNLAYGCGLLFAGRMADIWGRKLLFISGLIASIAFSFISGGMRHTLALCIIRAFTGLGLAVATPAGFGIIGVTFRQEPGRTIAFAVFGLGNPIGASVGVLVGGAVAGINAHGWQYFHFVLGGLALIPLILGLFVIPRDLAKNQATDKRIDWLGGLLITAALCLFTFSITQSGIAPKGWGTPYIPALLATSIVLFGLFGLWEHHVEHRLSLPPIAKLSLFTRDGWKITIVMLCAFCPFVAVAGWVYLTTLFYQEYKGFTALNTAIHTVPAAICGIFAALAVMWIVPRLRTPYVLALGGFLSGMACIIYAVEPTGTLYWKAEFIALLLLPFGADLTVGIGSILMSNLCNDNEQSVGGALFQTATQIAAAIGICVSSLVTNDVATRKGDYYTGLRTSFFMCSAFAFVVVALAFGFMRKWPLAKHVGFAREDAAH
ncbi:Efflux pump terJ [Vanrija pseudolonga]|nr:Efflux pump terJ [Vanrija pseudolonga]